MLISTFNANSIRARIELIIKWLRERECHTLCVQETKVEDHAFPRTTFEDLSYNVYFRGQKSYNCVAILSKAPLLDIQFGFGDGRDSEEDRARVMMGRMNDIHIYNIYAPQGRAVDHPEFQKKLLWYARLASILEERHHPNDHLLILGDFNCAPGPADVTSPERKKNHVCFHRAVRDAFKTLIDWGLYDCFRHFHSEARQFTFFDYRVPKAVQRNIGWRIDHILATGPMLQRISDCFIDLEPRLWERPSDHTFLCARID